ncbi:MAG: hypothetical protein JO203_14460 [Gammaproteobacteria bacterium]|nr:hypothetical protein [Gammaproteobacteria bacterium]
MMLLCFIAGVAAGVAASLAGGSLRRLPLAALLRRRPVYFACAAVAACFAIAAGTLYLSLGARQVTHGDVAGSAGGPPAPPAGATPSRSMAAEVAGLEARLARAGGSPADWSLLAQGYEFLGRTEEARRARLHAANHSDPAVSDLSAASLSALAAETQGGPSLASGAPGGLPRAAPPTAASGEPVAGNADEAERWLALAAQRRAQRDNAGARDAFLHAVRLQGMTAQAWADYADTLGSLADGSLTGEAGEAIDHALALEPANPKALWLKASQAHERRQYREALEWWQKLRAALGPDSPDGQIIAANIAEDSALAGRAAVNSPAAAVSPVSPPAAASAVSAVSAVSGTVSLAARFAARVQPDATLFIYAKAADSPGPPLAVLRTTVSSWPVSFTLDDSMAMLPARRLSQFDRVVIEARISRSGQATPGAGDLYVTTPVMRPAGSGRLALVIDREIS